MLGFNNFLRVLDNLNSERVKLWNFNYGLNKTISMEIQKNARGDTMPVYVSPILRGKVLDYIRITHQNSDNIFKVGHEER